MKKTTTPAILAAVLASLSTTALAQNLLTNGSFELPGFPGDYMTVPSGSTYIPGWTVGADGDIDIVGTHWPASDGTNSLDLNGLTAGSISQSVVLTNGTLYLLAFDMAYNKDTALPASMELSFGTYTQKVVSPTGSGSPFWQRRSFTFTVTNTGATAVTFRDTSGHSFGGAALDNVTLLAISSALEVNMYAGVRIEGLVGHSYRIEYVNALSSPNWTPLINIVLSSSPFLLFDVNSTGVVKRFYRAVELP